jgi:hypothetical protein
VQESFVVVSEGGGEILNVPWGEGRFWRFRLAMSMLMEMSWSWRGKEKEGVRMQMPPKLGLVRAGPSSPSPGIREVGEVRWGIIILPIEGE